MLPYQHSIETLKQNLKVMARNIGYSYLFCILKYINSRQFSR